MRAKSGVPALSLGDANPVSQASIKLCIISSLGCSSGAYNPTILRLAVELAGMKLTCDLRVKSQCSVQYSSVRYTITAHAHERHHPCRPAAITARPAFAGPPRAVLPDLPSAIETASANGRNGLSTLGTLGTLGTPPKAENTEKNIGRCEGIGRAEGRAYKRLRTYRLSGPAGRPPASSRRSRPAAGSARSPAA